MNYLQGRKRDTEIENVCVDTFREGEGGTNWEIRIGHIQLLHCSNCTTTLLSV